MHDIDYLNKVQEDIRATIRSAFRSSQKPIFQHTDGRRLFLDEVIKEGLDNSAVIGALSVVYAPGNFMSLDRIVKSSNKFKKERRIIYYLDSRPGQIGSTLLLELLRLDNGEEFSKHKFVSKIDKEYFQAENINISTGEINEALSRMFRKTMPRFFAIDGHNFTKFPFVLKVQKLNINNSSRVAYENYKREIDMQTHQLLRNLNKSIT